MKPKTGNRWKVDIKTGILCCSDNWKKQEEGAATISLESAGTKLGVCIDLGFVRNLFRSCKTSSRIIQPSTNLPKGITASLPRLNLKTRKDLERLAVWPVIQLKRDSLHLRNINITSLVGKRHVPKSTSCISFSHLAAGLDFPNGVHTSMMRQPEVVSLIEGVDFAYPKLRFIRDFSGSESDFAEQDTDWFRSVADAPSLWLGIRCILCNSTRFATRHIIGSSRVVHCSNCGLEFNNPQAVISPGQLNKYSSRFDYLRKGIPSVDRAEQNAYIFIDDLEMISPLLKGHSLLEIGPASGEFLNLLHVKYGWGHERLHGIEPSAVSVQDAKNKFNLYLYHSTAEDFAEKTERFSVIVILNSIEHFSKPHKALQAIRSRLRDDGLLFIGTIPNNECLVSQLFPEGFTEKNFPDGENHYYFNPRTFIKLCRQEGFETVLLRGRKRNIVRRNFAATARWLAFSCGIDPALLFQEQLTMREIASRIEATKTRLNLKQEFSFSSSENDFLSYQSIVSFWQREIWPSPYLSETFDIWLRPVPN